MRYLNCSATSETLAGAAKQSQDIANGVNSNLNSIRVGMCTVEGSASSNLAEKAQKTIKSEDEQN